MLKDKTLSIGTIFLLLVVLLALLWSIGAPPAGAHGWNEARYLLEWASFIEPAPDLDKIVGDFYISHSPILLYISYPIRYFNADKWMVLLRLLMLGCGFITLYTTLSIARLSGFSIERQRITLLTLISIPYFLYISRTIQLEAPQTMFLMLAVYYIIRWEREDKGEYLFSSQVFLLLSIAVKYSSLFFLLFFYYRILKKIGWKKDNLSTYLIPVFIVILPTAIYLYSLYSYYGGKAFFDTLFGYAFGESGKATPLDILNPSFYGNAVFWLFFTSSLYISFLFLKKKEETSSLDEAFIPFFLLYFIFYHKHDYYLYPLLPFLALAVARRVPNTGFFKGLWIAGMGLGFAIYIFIFSYFGLANSIYYKAAGFLSGISDDNKVILMDRPQTLFAYRVLLGKRDEVIYKPRWDNYDILKGKQANVYAVFLERFNDKRNIKGLHAACPSLKVLKEFGGGRIILDKERLLVIKINK